jgi:hypothetical protein
MLQPGDAVPHFEMMTSGGEPFSYSTRNWWIGLTTWTGDVPNVKGKPLLS